MLMVITLAFPLSPDSLLLLDNIYLYSILQKRIPTQNLLSYYFNYMVVSLHVHTHCVYRIFQSTLQKRV